MEESSDYSLNTSLSASYDLDWSDIEQSEWIQPT